VIVQSSDLQNINKFRSLNDQLTESTTLISESQQQKEALEDAINELELADEDEKIDFLIGSIYCKISIEQARQEMSDQVEQLVKSMDETSLHNFTNDFFEECSLFQIWRFYQS
jgi:chaperonin cofactor prefoldin